MQSLGKALNTFLKSAGIDKAVIQQQAILDWPEIVGPSIAEQTEPQQVEHGVLLIKVSTPTWRQELQFQKQDIIKKLNQHLSQRVIKDIRFV